MRRGALALAMLLAMGCGEEPPGPCDPVQQPGCVADAGAGADGGAVVDDAGPPSDAGTAVDAGVDAGLMPADGGGLVPPDPPVFPATIGNLSIAIRTGYGVNDGTDANELSVCLSATDCFEIDVVNVNDFRVGEIDVYHYEDVGLPRSSVDRVEIRSVNGTDRWRPVCMEIRFDGEPVYCEDQLGMTFGSAAGLLTEWTDPQGLHQRCRSCYPRPVVHGPMVGAVGPHSARVWMRTDATRRVGLHLLEDGDLGSAPVVAWGYPSPRRDYTQVFDVNNLRPQTRYHYFFEVDGVPDWAIHSFRTAPALGSKGKVRMAYGSCTRLDDQPIFELIRAVSPDVFFFVGDNHYANSSDRDSLRFFYRWALEKPERAALVANVPTLAVWDDHDFVGNNTFGTEPGRDVALRTFKEYWANESFGTPDTPGIFSKYSYGDLDFFLLDDRYYRGVEGNMLGAAQEAWLRQELKASTATFKFLVMGSQWTAAGSSDSWAVYLPARNALFDFVRDERIGGVVLLSGDTHYSEFRLISRTAAGAYDLPEITSSPMANTNFTCGTDGEVRACFDSSNYFVTIETDTAIADPALTARIYDQTGVVVATWTLTRSQLE